MNFNKLESKINNNMYETTSAHIEQDVWIKIIPLLDSDIGFRHKCKHLIWSEIMPELSGGRVCHTN